MTASISGTDAERADERLVGKGDLLVEAYALLGDFHLLHPLGQRVVQQCGMRRSNEAAEFLDKRRRADRLLPARNDRVDVDCEHVALFGALNGDRAALRIEEGKVQQLRRAVALLCYLSLEGVLCFRDDDVARLDPEHRLGIRPVDVVVVALRSLRSAHALRRACLRRRLFAPCRTIEPNSSGPPSAAAHLTATAKPASRASRTRLA